MKNIGWYWRIIFLGIGGWTVFGVFFACQAYLSNAYFGRSVSFRQTLFSWLTCSSVWMLLTPLIYKLARRFPLEKGKLRLSIAVHLFAAALISLFALGVYTVAWQLLNGIPISQATWRSYQNLLVADFHFNLLVYLILIGLYFAYDYYCRFRENERRAAQLEIETARLETRLAQARLNALKMQIHPHFLFNTLNSISVLMRDDVPAANRMLVRLSELLRVTLNSEAAQEVPLRKELEFLRDYLEIEQVRFQDRLTIDFDVENETLDAQVPNLILQPLVENAIRHAIAPLSEAGIIQIRARRENGFVRLSVSDNGAGLKEPPGLQTNGIGLKNTRERLEKLYGERQKFEIVSGAGGGFEVKIKIPYHKKNEQ